MNQLQIEFPTKMSVEECAGAFRNSVQKSYGASRKLIGGLSALRGGGGGIEFFTPSDGPFDGVGQSPAWKAGAFVPGHSKMHGATKMAVHIYVSDEGNQRIVQLIGPYSMGDKGSTERLLKRIREGF